MIIDPSKLLYTTLPVDPELMRRYTQLPSAVFQVDLSKPHEYYSTRDCLEILSNDQIHSVLTLANTTPERLEEIVSAWFEVDCIVDVAPLPQIAAKILLHAIEVENDLPVPTLVTKEWLDHYVDTHPEQLRKVCGFLDSVYYVYLPETVNEKTVNAAQYPVLEDVALGKSLVLLAGMGTFPLYYTNIFPDLSQLHYYRPQFTEEYYRGQSLWYWLNTESAKPATDVLSTYFKEAEVVAAEVIALTKKEV